MKRSAQDDVNSESPANMFAGLQGIQSQTLLRQALYKLFATLFLYPNEDLIISLKTYAEELVSNSSVWEEYIFADKLSR